MTTNTPPVSDEAVEAATRNSAVAKLIEAANRACRAMSVEIIVEGRGFTDEYADAQCALRAAITAAAPFMRADGELRKALEEIAAFGTEDAPYRNIEDAILIAYRGLDAADKTLTMPGSPDCQTRHMALEEAAQIAENVRGGYTANVRIDESEQELIPDPDGPWVLNSEIAKAIRALAAQDAPGKDAT